MTENLLVHVIFHSKNLGSIKGFILISSIFEQIFSFPFDHIVQKTRGQKEEEKDAKKSGTKKCV